MAKIKKMIEKTVKKAAEAERRVTHQAAAREDHVAVKAAGAATELADQPPLVALSLATLAVGLLMRRPTVIRSGARMVASHAIATGIKTVLKTAVDRTRPSRALEEGHRVEKGKGSGDTSLNSFPSGHTAGAVAVAQAVAAEASPAAAAPLQAAAGGVALLQPSRGQHYVSDVIAGAAIGWVSNRIAGAVMRIGESGVEAGLKRWRRG